VSTQVRAWCKPTDEWLHKQGHSLAHQEERTAASTAGGRGERLTSNVLISVGINAGRERAHADQLRAALQALMPLLLQGAAGGGSPQTHRPHQTTPDQMRGRYCGVRFSLNLTLPHPYLTLTLLTCTPPPQIVPPGAAAGGSSPWTHRAWGRYCEVRLSLSLNLTLNLTLVPKPYITLTLQLTP